MQQRDAAAKDANNLLDGDDVVPEQDKDLIGKLRQTAREKYLLDREQT